MLSAHLARLIAEHSGQLTAGLVKLRDYALTARPVNSAAEFHQQPEFDRLGGQFFEKATHDPGRVMSIFSTRHQEPASPQAGVLRFLRLLSLALEGEERLNDCWDWC